MSHTKFVAMSLLAIFLDNGHCLNKEQIDLVGQILATFPKCTVMLYKLETADVNKISPTTKTPFLVVDETRAYSLQAMREQLSARESYCAILLAQENTLNISNVESLLNQTRHRFVYVFHAAMGKQGCSFRPYFKDSVIRVATTMSGNLLFSRIDNVKRILWVKKTKKLLPFHGHDFFKMTTDRATLRNKNVTISTVPLVPFVIYLPNKRYRGIEMNLFDIIARKIGFNYNVREEKYWHERDLVTHKWLGSLGSIIDGHSQFATSINIGGFDITDSPVEFTPQTYSQEVVYVSRKPKPLQPLFNFYRPFTATVWLSVFASFFLCSLCAFLFIYFHDQKSISLSRILFDMFGTIWQQKLKDSLVSPNSGKYCLIFGFWIIGMTFKGAAYNCDLRSYIFKKEYEKPIETDEDLLESNLNIYIAADTGFVRVFQQSASLAKRMLYARAVQRGTVYPFKVGIGPYEEMLIREGGARTTPRLRTALVLAMFEKHYGYQPLRVAKTTIESYQKMLMMPQYQPWSEEFSKAQLHLIAGGFVDILTRRNLPFSKYNYPVEEVEKLEPYKMEHVVGPLFVLGGGLFLSFIVFFCEAAIFNMKNYRIMAIEEINVIL